MIRPRLLPHALAPALVLALACERVPENAPGVTQFNGERPTPSYNEGADGGVVDLDTFCNGGPPVSDPDCAVSFANQIYGILNAPQPAGCVAGGACHGAPDVQLGGPLDGTPDATWNLLVAYPFQNRASQKIPYVNICSTDPEQSGITCNLNFGAACGTKMPKNRPEMDDASKQLIAEWLTCGAPNN